jgi:hypothetical protein
MRSSIVLALNEEAVIKGQAIIIGTGYCWDGPPIVMIGQSA